MSVQLIKAAELRTTAGGPGIEGRLGVIYVLAEPATVGTTVYAAGTPWHWETSGVMVTDGGPAATFTAAEVASTKAAVSGGGIARGVGQSVMVRPVGGPDFSVYDTSSFRQIFQTPHTGLCLVRARYETDATSTDTISATAFAGGRAIADDNPLDAAGAGAVWTVVTNTATSAADASAATNGLVGYGWSSWALVNIPAPTDGGIGGYVYVGTKRASGTGKCHVGNSGRPSTDWQDTVNALLTSLKYRAMHKSGVDVVTTVQNTLTSPTYLSYFVVSAGIEVVPLTSRTLGGINVGDSTSQGLGTGTPATQPHNYNWASIATNTMLAAGAPVAIANYGMEGRTSANYLARFELLLADTEFNPAFVILQPFSTNDSTFDETLVLGGLQKTLTLCRKLRSRGITPILRTVMPNSGTNSGQDAVRARYNAAILASGEVVLDLSAVVSDTATPARLLSALTYDGIHLNRTGNEACAAVLRNLLRNLYSF